MWIKCLLLFLFGCAVAAGASCGSQAYSTPIVYDDMDSINTYTFNTTNNDLLSEVDVQWTVTSCKGISSSRSYRMGGSNPNSCGIGGGYPNAFQGYYNALIYSNASQPFLITKENAFFVFYIAYDLETGPDRVALYASVDGGEWAVVRDKSALSAGSAFMFEGNYTSSGAWSGYHPLLDFIKVVVDLRNIKGRSVMFSWSASLDESGSAMGFFVDNIGFAGQAPACAPNAPTFSYVFPTNFTLSWQSSTYGCSAAGSTFSMWQFEQSDDSVAWRPSVACEPVNGRSTLKTSCYLPPSNISYFRVLENCTDASQSSPGSPASLISLPPIIDHCYTYSGLVCGSCENQYVLSTDQRTCYPAIPSCKNQTNDQCNECLTNFTLSSNRTMCFVCFVGTYLTTGFECVQCPIGYTTSFNGSTQASDCNACLPGYSRDGVLCTACEIGTYSTGVNSTCIACDIEETTSTNGSLFCDICAGGYGFNGTNCTACSEAHCAECHLNASECTFCNAPYVIDGLVCSGVCPDGKGNISGICQVCTDNNCAKCDLAVNACTRCEIGWLVDGTICVSQCPDGKGNDSNGACEECADTHCQNCANDATQCNMCIGGYVLDEFSCLSSCPDGKRNNSGICVDCADSHCKTCSSAVGVCDTCEDGYSLDGSSCVSVCPDGKRNNTGVCEDCVDIHCKTCASSVSQCTSCETGFFLDGTSCTAQCPAGKHNTSDGTCEANAPRKVVIHVEITATRIEVMWDVIEEAKKRDVDISDLIFVVETSANQSVWDEEFRGAGQNVSIEYPIKNGLYYLRVSAVSAQTQAIVTSSTQNFTTTIDRPLPSSSSSTSSSSSSSTSSPSSSSSTSSASSTSSPSSSSSSSGTTSSATSSSTSSSPTPKPTTTNKPTPSPTSTQGPTDGTTGVANEIKEKKKSSLSTGAKVGIAIGVIAGVGMIVAAIVLVFMYRKRDTRASEELWRSSSANMPVVMDDMPTLPLNNRA